ncbi:glycosyl hydrolase family 18 protein [Actinomycetospora endophytica]|uniref:Glycosyl hydrolase family 18 protein n=1 Tax=Actinomycetospora endophytica TaxID=2291215 RepID=A0ABS8PCE7_9PSEU|nr:glycosyl hydrolase family 18 protein [Actinomycetospora endophytica]MCD2195927.1 glycosyl hydrolase family 18 protein [Actinomycetospora endophytica]
MTAAGVPEIVGRSVRHDPSYPTTARRRSPALLVALLVAAVLAVVVVVNARSHPGGETASLAGAAGVPAASASNLVVASIPYWDLGPGSAAVEANPHAVGEISPWIYTIGSNGNVTSAVPPQDTATATATMTKLRSLGVPIMPSVSNMVGGDFSYGAVAPVLHDPATMERNISSITQLAVAQNYAGIDLDYEELQGGDRAAFSTFVTQLADSLHAQHKKLSVAVFAKTDDAGEDQRNVAQDYAAIGAAADEVRLMTYDYHWQTSPPGPLAPSGWVHDVLAYATTVIPREKLVVGLDAAGYDWVGNQAQVLSFAQATQLAASHGVTVQFDPLSQSPWFRYTDARGTEHEVWFENTASSQAKRSVAASFGVTNVFLWMFGPPDPTLWGALGSPPPGGTG